MRAGPQGSARWAVLAVAVAAVTGCASSMACSSVGCVSGLSVSAPRMVHGQRVTWMRVCVARSCRTDEVGHGSGPYGAGSAPTRDLQVHRPVKVSVTLETADRAKLMTAAGSVRFRKVAPNGVKCGPVCYEADVTVGSGGTLTAT